MPAIEEGPDELELREYRGELDDPLIYHTWCKHIRRLDPFWQFSNDEFLHHRQRLGQLVQRSRVVLAHNPAAPEAYDQIYGYAIGEKQGALQVLHFAYVRAPFRRFGIGQKLLIELFPNFKKDTLYCSHPGRSLPHLSEKWKLVLNPYLVLTHQSLN